jgi:hydrogenase maturation protein HypF
VVRVLARRSALNAESRAVTSAPRIECRQESIFLHVTGVVQGVGFRPFVHRLAVRHRLRGWVRNEAGNVVIAAEGDADELSAFITDLRAEAPPLARIDTIDVSPQSIAGLPPFHIAASSAPRAARQPVSPDVALCDDCARELADPTNRRYHYPFITCTNCGPRHSIIQGMPYDRERTSMRAFTMCPECRREYDSIDDRRYHSQTNSCPDCGPSLRFIAPRTHVDERGDQNAIHAASRLLATGGIVALRGLGGFHIACDATNEAAVALLRKRKHRDGKPFAVMVATLDDARRLASISRREAEWLESPERPIVVLAAAEANGIAPSVSNGLTTLGVMLAYTPLHVLLLQAAARPLVMTSGNLSHQPLEITLSEATRSLGPIADAFLTHDREIVARIDDSVLRIAGDEAVHLRRARGLAPLPIRIPIATPEALVAVGPHLKNTFALAAEDEVFLSQHIGDLETVETMQHWRATLAAFREFYGIVPNVAVRDLHPEYLSTTLAEELELAEVLSVQHHHAHIAAVAAEHGVCTPVLGISFDGTGYGDDGRIWGAEWLVADLTGYRRAGHLRYAPLPGGDLAARTPWRSALGYLSLASHTKAALSGLGEPDLRERRLAMQQCERRINAPEASSMGRLFDAAAAVLGVCSVNRFEGEAAMRLESLAGRRTAEPFPLDATIDEQGVWVLDPVPLLIALAERRACGDDVEELAARFHESVADSAASLATRIARDASLDIVALGGGCFQNARLLISLRDRLASRGLRVLTARRLPPNDGAISYGQAAIGAATLRARRR